MVLNFLNFSTLSQFVVVKLFNKSFLLRIILLCIGKSPNTLCQLYRNLLSRTASFTAKGALCWSHQRLGLKSAWMGLKRYNYLIIIISHILHMLWFRGPYSGVQTAWRHDVLNFQLNSISKIYCNNNIASY